MNTVHHVTLGLLLATSLLTGCGDKSKPATQAAARVNSGEITVHQINQVLEAQRGLRQEQVEAASRQALERLIDQELAVQQATDNKLDREPRVVAAIEAAKRDILTRAYLERAAESASKPSADEIQAYYTSHPGLFSNRRIYTLAEVTVQGAPELAAELQTRAEAAKSASEFVDLVKSRNLPYQFNEVRQAAEGLPLNAVEAIAATPEGKALVSVSPQGVKAIFVMSAKPAPVSMDQARPAIEQFISNDRKRALVDAEVKRLRSIAKIEYLGKFAEAASGVPAATPTPAPAPAASGALDDSALKKGLGIK